MVEESSTTETVERDNNLYTMNRGILRRSINDRYFLLTVPFSRSVSFLNSKNDTFNRDVVGDTCRSFKNCPNIPSIDRRKTLVDNNFIGSGQNFRRLATADTVEV